MIGPGWMQALVTGIRAGLLDLSSDATPKNFFKLPNESTDVPTCNSRSSYPCCYVDVVTFRFDSDQQADLVIHILEALPKDDVEKPTEVWNRIDWTFSLMPDVMPNNGSQPTVCAPSMRASRSTPALRAAGG